MLLGIDGKRKLRLRHKGNEELFRLYSDQLALKHRNNDALEEAKRVLVHFQSYLGEYPPSPELAAGFLAQFINNKPATLYRYHAIIKGFMAWYGEPLQSKIAVPQTLPPYIEDSDVEKLKQAMASKRTHKGVVERNLLIIDLIRQTGLRREEVSNLSVRDIDLTRQVLIVREGKGMKDRAIDLVPSLVEKLRTYIKDKQPTDRVFDLQPSTISGLIRWAAKKTNLNLHCHSLRHSFAQRLIDTGADLEIVRQLMGHTSLAVTQRYLGRTNKQRKQAIDRLDGIDQEKAKPANKLEEGQKWLIPASEFERLKGQVLGDAQTKQKPYEETLHQQKMWDLARNLINEIRVPWMLDSFMVEMKPQRLLYADSRGHTLCPPIVINENGEISIELSTDNEGEIDHLHKGLCSHLKTGGFSELLSDIENWKSKFGQYLVDCHGFLKAVIGKIENDKNVKIPLDDKELKTGFTIDFPKMICHGAFCTIAGSPVLTYKMEPHPFHNKLLVLRYGACGIYLAETEEELRNYQRFHENLIAEYAGEQVTRDLVKEYQELNRLGGQIVQQLEVFRDMEHVRGHCDLCSK